VDHAEMVNSTWRSAAKLLTKDEARRIAVLKREPL
jgi:hypothetical protein